MFNYTQTVRSPYQAIAMLVAVALVLWTIGITGKAQAANLVEVSNLLTDSAPSAQSGHTVTFNVPAGSDITGDVTIEFPVEFTDVGTVVNGDVTVTGMGGSPTASGAGQTVTISGGTAGASDSITIAIDEGVITNPADTGSYEITVTTVTSDGTDVGNTRVVIIDTVLVTAVVETVFEFTISGTATGTPVFVDEETTGGTTATSVDFGVLTPGEEYLLAQQLQVETNAGNGFVVTVETDTTGELVSATGADINTFVDGSGVASPTTWVSPSNDVLDDTTWGHWGFTSNDSTLNNSSFGSTFAADQYIAFTGAPQPVFWHDGPADNTTQDIGQMLIGYKIEITALQEAANDYQATLTFIATPTF